MRTCAVAGCGRPWKKRDWCGLHYARWLRNGEPGEAETRRPGKRGLPALCHPERGQKAKGLCNACYQRALEKKSRKANLKHFYNITEVDEARMLSEQAGTCAICREPFGGTPRVDHDHACCPGHRSCGNCVRGLLCNACNSALGYLKDSPDRAMAAAAYLLSYQDVLMLARG